MTEQPDKSVNEFVLELLNHPVAAPLEEAQRNFIYGAIIGLLGRYGIQAHDRLYVPGSSEGQLGVDLF